MSEKLPERPLRVGDAQRQQAVDRLSQGYELGMLSLDEFSERTDQAWAATTTVDLEQVLRDLPVAAMPPSGQALAPTTSTLPQVIRTDGSAGVPLTVALMSGTDRSGDWTAAGNHVAVAIMGGVGLDLREASFTEPETTITAVAIMGGVEVIVPPHVRVRVHGLPLMGGFGAEGSVNPATLPPDAPLVTITGVAIMGGVGVKRLDYDED
ncbi:DUF1707 SHOCT-like domain-containing protein [Luteococcus sp. OSA5]|uniref:DUF1707 SHOCT-like domain-containing protein n=1 Tax=Luteococcus sp. OSA5 TaxID=3401630 RepID=UPI003B437C71